MINIFHGTDQESHRAFQEWRKANVNGFHMTEKTAGQFVIHYAQDNRENSAGRGCIHQGGSGNEYRDDKDGCYPSPYQEAENLLDRPELSLDEVRHGEILNMTDRLAESKVWIEKKARAINQVRVALVLSPVAFVAGCALSKAFG
jgi:hypothetical protein